MFGRRRQKDDGAAITEFWQWWGQARERVDAAIGDGTVERLAGEITDRVRAIHRDLQWELTKGSGARHALVVSPGGDATLRAAAARWRAAAPTADEVFEYFAARQPDGYPFDSRIQIAGHDLELGELRFAFPVRDDDHELDVGVYHPSFSQMPEAAVLQVTFLALDWALGEQQVELWVGEVEPMRVGGPGLRTYLDLRAAVAAMAARHAEPVYVVLGAEDKRGRPVMAMVQVPLKSARWPRFDQHIAITARYPAQPNGLPTEESLTQLRELEDRVESVLPPDGEVIAHETSNGVRTIHVYVDSTTSKAEAVSSVAGSFNALKTGVNVNADPGFEGVAHLRP